MAILGGLSELFLVGLIIDIIGFIIHIVGMATLEWSLGSNEFGDYTFGLLRFCFGSTCGEYPDPSSAGKAAAAMAIIGVIFAGAAIIVAVVHVINRNIKLFPKVSGGLSIAAFIFVLIGVIIWGADVNHNNLAAFDLGYSFGLSTAGGCLFLIGGVLLLIDKTPI